MNRKINRALKSAGFTDLLDIQQECISSLEHADDVILLSKTGSGKTLAFLLSIITKLDETKTNEVQALVVAPTRELCIQIENVFRSLKTGYKVTTCYGGHSVQSERNSLSEAPAVIIATPGRLQDHIYRRNVDLRTVDFLVIDEFDKCLEFGFLDSIEDIYEQLKHLKHHVLTSATRLDNIPEFLRISSPVIIDAIKEDDTLDLVEYVVNVQEDTMESLTLLIASFGMEKSMIFVNYREVCDDVQERLYDNGITCAIYHGGLEQEMRERQLIKFSNGTANTIVCTDLGARGLDIPDVKHIVHYQYPGSESAFVHRKGRTARMGGSGGFSYLFISKKTELPMYITEPGLSMTPEYGPVPTPEWETIYIGGGKKDKIGKIDVVGFCAKVGKLAKDEIGMIDSKDRHSYVAIKRSKCDEFIRNIKGEKIKGKRLKVAVAR
ncbi:MAG: superfamily II DNA/RNA helicase [Crocinitomicaceae bacterium]|jgi:superfamily II DNA/RNA helicase